MILLHAVAHRKKAGTTSGPLSPDDTASRIAVTADDAPWILQVNVDRAATYVCSRGMFVLYAVGIIIYLTTPSRTGWPVTGASAPNLSRTERRPITDRITAAVRPIAAAPDNQTPGIALFPVR